MMAMLDHPAGVAPAAEMNEALRRVRPRPWDTDWLVLRELSAALLHQIKTCVRPGESVLDFGCGSMPYRSYFLAQGSRYVGADFGNDADVRIGSDGTLPLPDGSVDVVLSAQVLEHVRDLDGYLSESRRVMNGDGRLLLSTHGTWLYHPHPEDHRRWTRTGLIEDLQKRGFRIEYVRAVAGPLATTTIIRLTAFAYVLRHLPVFGPVLAGALTLLMNGRAWVEDRLTPPHIRENDACVYLVRCRKAFS